jgi:ribonuclease HI
VHIFADSKYVLQGITTWIHGWKKNNWRTASKAPVLNQELWQELDEVRNQVSQKGFEIEWTYVKGHSDNAWNARADEIATTCADSKEMADKDSRVFYDGVVVKR